MVSLTEAEHVYNIYYPLPDTKTEEGGAVTLQAGFAPNNQLDLEYKMQFQKCYDMFRIALDGCDSGSAGRKRGGVIMKEAYVGNDARFCLLDPNPVPDYSNIRWTGNQHVAKEASRALQNQDWCKNDNHHFSPDAPTWRSRTRSGSVAW